MRNKITPFQYAVFLYEITFKKHEVKKIIKDFFDVLIKNNDLGKIKDIMREFEAYEKKQKGIKEIAIASAEPFSREFKKQIRAAAKGLGISAMEESINPDLIGGLTLVVGDTMIDGSLRNKLRELNKALSYGGPR